MTIPYWIQDAIFYQIFPDRFADGDPWNDPVNVQPWGSTPDLWSFQGGDLRGIINKFGYLLELGVNAIYLNPIFQSTSNHRYNTTDYYTIDPKLGNLRDFQALVNVAHANDVRIILDGVFNHCGRGFFAFNDLLENQEYSAYKDWFHVTRFPLDAYTNSQATDYQAWWGIKSLPKFNTANPAARSYLLNVARYWIEQGVDGWRLDVPNEINDDSFWSEFRHVVKTANQDAYIMGEIWNNDPRWVGESHCDGITNYPLRDYLVRFIHAGTLSATQFVEKIDAYFTAIPHDNQTAMYFPLSSHDTERIFTKLEGNLDKIKLAFLFQFAFPGVPAIYYGDEIGLPGGKDPDCRGAFPWEKEQWKQELRDYVKRLISARKRSPALRRGDYLLIHVDDQRNCLAFARELGEEQVLAVFNASPATRYLHLNVKALEWEDGQIKREMVGDKEYLVSGDEMLVTLAPYGGALIH